MFGKDSFPSTSVRCGPQRNPRLAVLIRALIPRAMGTDRRACFMRIALLLGCWCPAVHTAFHKMFDAECTSGSEIRMYAGNGDNPGTSAQRASRCSEACLTKKTPLSGSWISFVARGFIVYPTSGRCYCENANSATCSKNANGYDRYDWGTLHGSPSHSVGRAG